MAATSAVRVDTVKVRYGNLWWLPKRFTAITLPPFGIFIRRGGDISLNLLAHEHTHWRQYKRWGLVGFYARYLWWSVRFGYRENPMELEARGRQQSYAAKVYGDPRPGGEQDGG